MKKVPWLTIICYKNINWVSLIIVFRNKWFIICFKIKIMYLLQYRNLRCFKPITHTMVQSMSDFLKFVAILYKSTNILKAITRKSLNELLCQCPGDFNKKLTYMENEFIKITKCPTGEDYTLRRNLKYSRSEMVSCWQQR